MKLEKLIDKLRLKWKLFRKTFYSMRQNKGILANIIYNKHFKLKRSIITQKSEQGLRRQQGGCWDILWFWKCENVLKREGAVTKGTRASQKVLPRDTTDWAEHQVSNGGTGLKTMGEN